MVFVPKTHATPGPQSNHEKNRRQIPTEGHPTIFLTSTPQNCQRHQKQGNPEKLPQKRAV